MRLLISLLDFIWYGIYDIGRSVCIPYTYTVHTVAEILVNSEDVLPDPTYKSLKYNDTL